MSLISVISTVLSVILFFKVWRMCDDVKRIADSMCGPQDGVATDMLNARIVAGDKTAINDLRKAMLNEFQTIAKNAQGIDEEDYSRIYGTSIASQIAEIKAKYSKLYKAAHSELPKEISRIKTAEDLWSFID